MRNLAWAEGLYETSTRLLMKIQHLMALVVLSLATVPGARAAIREFKARTLGLLALACLLVAAPATAQVNYAVSGNTAYVAYSPNASGDIELLEGSHLQVHVNWGHEAMGRQIRNQKSEITNRQLWRKEPDLNSTARSMLGVS